MTFTECQKEMEEQKMKKVVSLLLVLAVCLGLCACGGGKSSQFVGMYEDEGQYTEHYSGWGYDNLVNDISCIYRLTLNDGGTGTFERKATSDGKFYKYGDYIEKGTVHWIAEDNYVSVTFKGTKYTKDYGNDKEEVIDRTETYERKAGTLHYTTGGVAYTKIG